MTGDDSVFNDDYTFFENQHATHPARAEAVFRIVAELRAALSTFRRETVAAEVESNAVVELHEASGESNAVAELLHGASDESKLASDAAQPASLGFERSSSVEVCDTASEQ